MKNKILTLTVTSILLTQVTTYAQLKAREPLNLKKTRIETKLDEGSKAQQLKLITDYVANLTSLGKGLAALGSNKSIPIDSAKLSQSIETSFKITYGSKKEMDEAVDVKSNLKNILSLSEKRELSDQGLVSADLHVRTIEFLGKNSGSGDNVEMLYKFMQIHHDLIVKSSSSEVKELKDFNDVLSNFLISMYQNRSQLSDAVFADALTKKLGSIQEVKNFFDKLKNCLKV